MAIRFQCAACGQPIEVDDDLAESVVGCPYCHKTVTAPVQSMLSQPSDMPVATPLGPADSLSQPAALQEQSGAPPRGNTLAVVAFSLACLLILVQVVSFGIVARHGPEFEEFAREIEKAGPEFSDKLSAVKDFLSRNGGRFPGWMIGFVLFQLAALMLCVSSIICSVLALRRPLRRGMAMAGLAISGGYLVLVFLA